MPRFPSAQGRVNHEPGFHLSCDENLSEGWGPPLPDTRGSRPGAPAKEPEPVLPGVCQLGSEAGWRINRRGRTSRHAAGRRCPTRAGDAVSG